MSAPAEDFTHAGYRALVAAFLERGYEVCSYADADPAARHLILRHDIDMSLQAAEPLAQIECEFGVSACYFVLLRTELYNLFTPAAQASVSHLTSLGHEIGLHLDASLYSGDADALDEAAERECRILEDIAGSPVRFISFHRPAPELLGYEGKLGGRIHAYQPRFFTETGYCSDSRGGWHHGHPLHHDAVSRGRALQLLTHPVWWGHLAGAEGAKKLDDFLERRVEFLERELAENCEPYRDALVNRRRI